MSLKERIQQAADDAVATGGHSIGDDGQTLRDELEAFKTQLVEEQEQLRVSVMDAVTQLTNEVKQLTELVESNSGK